MSRVSVYVDPKIQQVRDLYADLLADDLYSLPVRAQLELQADRMVEAHRNGDDAVCFQIGSWHPGLVNEPDDVILDHPFARDDGRATIAREHGFAGWHQVIAVEERRSDAVFERAVDTMLAGALLTLRELIVRSPALVGARSQYGHRATLLHYAGTNGVESYRQVVPSNLAEIVDLLLGSGADARIVADMYGGCTPRALFETSKHSQASGVHDAVVAVFKKYEVH